MREHEYQKMHELERSYWWFVGRKRIVSNQLAELHLDPAVTQLLNIGSGTGGTVAALEHFGAVTNIDTADEAIEYSARHNIAVQKVQVDELLPFADQSFDVLLALDVLEHIEHDQASLHDWYRVLRPGGRLLITVPAYPWLWSEHDEGLHHFRRYTLSELHQKCNLAGFRVCKRSYAITFSFPLVVGFRLFRSLRPQRPAVGDRHHASDSYVRLPRVINALFIGLLYVEAKVLKIFNLPFGTSIVLMAEKPRV